MFGCGAFSSALGANLGYWSQTSPGYVPVSTDVRATLAVWPLEVATNLTYFTEVASSPEMAARLRDTLRHAMNVWENAARLRFIPVSDRAQARMIINLNHTLASGHYHGYGGAWPPAREADGRLRTSFVNLGYYGEPDQAESWCDDSWVWCAVHELGHSLGFWHEFERADRDEYLRMVGQLPPSVLLPVHENEIGCAASLPFDYASIMMYNWADSDRNPQYRLVKPGAGLEPAPTVSMYQRNGLSPLDLQAVQWLYGPSLGKPALVHQPDVRDNSVFQILSQQGWSGVTNPYTAIYGCAGSLVCEADYGLYDHWTWGGSPPRIEKHVGGSPFDLSVEAETRYLPPGTYAGLFIMFNSRDWVYFGPCEHPRRIVSQRTGQSQSQPVTSDSYRYRLRAIYAGGNLRLSCYFAGEEHVVPGFNGLAPPTHIGLGIKSWGAGEYGYRCVRFRNIAFSAY